MGGSTEQTAPSWGWGTEGQVLACRLSQVLGLMAVLGLLLALGWTP